MNAEKRRGRDGPRSGAAAAEAVTLVCASLFAGGACCCALPRCCSSAPRTAAAAASALLFSVRGGYTGILRTLLLDAAALAALADACPPPYAKDEGGRRNASRGTDTTGARGRASAGMASAGISSVPSAVIMLKSGRSSGMPSLDKNVRGRICPCDPGRTNA